MQQDQDIKGFTLLELIVVIVIVGIISALGYPKFANWKDEREARSSTEKIASMLSNLGAQVNRGSLAYSQLYIIWKEDKNNPKENFPVFFTKGMRSSTYSAILNGGNTPECNMTSQGTWDAIKDGNSISIDKISYDNYIELFDPEQNDSIKIALQFENQSAVCFGKSGNYYKAKGDLPLKAGNRILKIEDINTPNYIIVCLKKTLDKHNLGKKCPRGNTLKEPAYLIKWSRFANISKYKWNENNASWNRQ